MRVDISKVPMDVWRRVANRLESIRGTPMAPGTKNAAIADLVCPIYRPGINTVAYWEFEITGLKKTYAREHEDKSSNTGFILAAAGRHDIPIPHWSVTMEPPSRALEAKIPQVKVGRILKLDTLAYAAEDARGQFLTNVGQLPLRIVGMKAGTREQELISGLIAKPGKPSKNDDSPGKMVITKEGGPAPDLKLVAWESWSASKQGYPNMYKPFLDALKKRAAEVWDIEDLIAKFGEGIHEGQQLTVPLLKPGKVVLSGDGVKFIKMTQVDRQPPAVILQALPSDEKQELSFQLVITYRDGTSETLQFFIVPKGTPSDKRVAIPPLFTTPEGGVIQ